ncbi:hypothetical protein A6V36_31820 [Paraburkholderia ginsengiterrae]|uniref:Zinc finger/thioredoxin putative domain-containing protein n=1 Tax=Paraburkholderia ginsengiterrae TaxID=1462993 RepID=A0ABX2USN4_9BURK|nr:zinc-ribbon and DUF3426 domain-containing protein [Paraburkholderia ginsengiterrae]OAJ57215.1 hypothetical protein A6V36_31820 [Paraburkholderia ginsengiterrae]
MLLATRCPFCETVFRLQTEQLALRRGLVRCGHCQEVFDASASLYDVTAGGDFSTAKPVAAAAAIEALSGVRPKGPDFSAEAWNPWAPTPDAAIDNRFLHNAGNVQLGKAATGADAAATPRAATEPELPPAATPAPLSPSDEPAQTEASREPPAYRADPFMEEAPRVWHKTERTSESPGDEPVLGESAALHGIPDNEPRFGATGLGAAGLGAAGPAAADPGAAGLGAGADTAGMGAAGRPDTAIPPAASRGEPFFVQPVNGGADPFTVVRETRAPEPRRRAWIIAGPVVAGLLIIALLAQLAWWQRETVLVAIPRSQALYTKVCATFGCQITPPHDIDGLQVEPSDLRQIDGPHKLELKMPLRNRFNVALAYPAIELTLLDDQNNVAVRRVLWPQDYVPPGTPIAGGLAPHTTQVMIVHLDTGNAVASNFRVQIFYP